MTSMLIFAAGVALSIYSAERPTVHRRECRV
jgi:hypothetical protein